MAYTSMTMMSLQWFCLLVCSTTVFSANVNEQALVTARKANVTFPIPAGSSSVSFESGGGSYGHMPPDDPGLPPRPRHGFFMEGEHITAAFYTLLDLTRTIFHLTDMFWDLLLSTWRFILRCTTTVCSLAVPSSSRHSGEARYGTVLFVRPPVGPVAQIHVTEEDSLEYIQEEISHVTGIPSGAYKIFKNSKEVSCRNFIYVVFPFS
ncbi:PREDICTED: uncharacterized protein LOC109464226 [Branchiostoma belcheri]|uniref:Uncharacterized protein LOC109464226 n=1 Tax=Branchiostoma belcheri TaxID=7741 RepID=A0A6P4XX88_BRABE|nr:PREDICTED: uncharacterized protein LOC109464226 [Branchiostoma belcheri]